MREREHGWRCWRCVLFFALWASVLIFTLIAILTDAAAAQEFKYKAKVSTTCQTARDHKHDDVVTVEMDVESWGDCELKGRIQGGKFKGRTYTLLFGGFKNYPKNNVKQKVKVKYDRSCGYVLMAVFPKDVEFR